jgi:hypothetical protein
MHIIDIHRAWDDLLVELQHLCRRGEKGLDFIGDCNRVNVARREPLGVLSATDARVPARTLDHFALPEPVDQRLELREDVIPGDNERTKERFNRLLGAAGDDHAGRHVAESDKLDADRGARRFAQAAVGAFQRRADSFSVIVLSQVERAKLLTALGQSRRPKRRKQDDERCRD